MVNFYDYLKAETEKANAFNTFSYQPKDVTCSGLTESQLAAFQSADPIQIGQQILLEHGNTSHDVALTITLSVTTTITINTLL